MIVWNKVQLLGITSIQKNTSLNIISFSWHCLDNLIKFWITDKSNTAHSRFIKLKNQGSTGTHDQAQIYIGSILLSFRLFTIHSNTLLTFSSL